MRTMIAVPCMDMVHTDFFRSCVGLDFPAEDEIQWVTCQGSLVYDARTKLAEIAIRDGCERVLWLDSDVIFDRNLYKRLMEHLDMGKEMVTGLYFGRKPPIHPIIYKEMRTDPETNNPVEVVFDDYERDSLFEVEACGFGAVMTSTELLRDVMRIYKIPFFPAGGFGEDLAFCVRARSMGHRIWCDSSIKVGHVGTAIYNEETYRAVRAAAREGTEE